MRVGELYQLKVYCLGNDEGTIGVCYDDYGSGISIIFPNGGYDGFSVDELDFFTKKIGLCKALSTYSFKNVMKLAEDFDKGYFKPAFKSRQEKIDNIINE